MLHVTYKTTDSIKVTTSSANALEVVIDYSVRNGSAYPGHSPAVASIAAATTTTLLAAPTEAESCFDIERMTFSAKGGANTITVLRRVSGTDYQETAVSLSSGDVLEYEDGTGYTTKDSNGSAKFSLNAVTSNLTVGGTLGVTGATTLTGGMAATLSPSASDGAALGTGSLMWSDLFLASGSVVNWNNGNVTLTHSAGLLTLLAGASLAFGSTAAAAGTIRLPNGGTINGRNAAGSADLNMFKVGTTNEINVGLGNLGSVAAGATLNLGTMQFGLLVIVDSADKAALFFVSNSTSIEISDPNNAFETGAGSLTRVYVDGSADLLIVNNTAGALTYRCTLIRSA